MERIIHWCKGYIKCRLYDGNIERFFQMCKVHEIPLWNMCYNDSKYTCCMFVSDFWKIRRFIKKTHVKIRIEKRYGYKFFIDRLFKRKFFIAGFCTFLIVLHMLSMRIWTIEIDGNLYYTDNSIRKYLYEIEGISLGTAKNNRMLEHIDENIRTHLKDISWVSSEIVGTTLIIKIEENSPVLKNQNLKTQNIYSDINGTIVSMVTRSGTPVVTLGDQVNIGDLLIEGSIPIYDDGFNVIENKFVGADGEIGIQTSETYYKRYDFETLSKKYDRTQTNLRIQIGNTTFSFGKSPKQNSSNYQHTTEYYHLGNRIHLTIDFFKPFETVHALQSISEAKAAAKKELSERLREFDEKGVQIIENNVRIIMYGDYIETSGTFVYIQPVGLQNVTARSHTENNMNGENYEYNGNDD